MIGLHEPEQVLCQRDLRDACGLCDLAVLGDLVDRGSGVTLAMRPQV
jgi:hypothetical protein